MCMLLDRAIYSLEKMVMTSHFTKDILSLWHTNKQDKKETNKEKEKQITTNKQR